MWVDTRRCDGDSSTHRWGDAGCGGAARNPAEYVGTAGKETTDDCRASAGPTARYEFASVSLYGVVERHPIRRAVEGSGGGATARHDPVPPGPLLSSARNLATS